MTATTFLLAILLITLSALVTARPSIRRATALPASPKGATLIQFKPCSGVSATVPMFVNNQYAKSTTTSAYIVQHGESADFNNYFTAVYNIIGTTGIIAAPNFYNISSTSGSKSWYQSSVNLAWLKTGNWTIGSSAIAPTSGTNALNGKACSSYDTYDTLLTQFNNKALYPNLKQVYMLSHSGGANAISRYSQINNGSYTFNIRYIIANAASQAYFTSARPETNPCHSAGYYPNQWVVDTEMSPYIRARFTTPTALFQRWVTRDVINLIGDLDTNSRYGGGTQDCGSVSEGGANRRDRDYAWWAYTNILAGTKTDVSSYTGYKQLLASGAKAITTSSTLKHQNCVISNVGHVFVPMLNSTCGRAALSQATIPAGVGAQYP
jgi:hypothetical protein